MSSFANRTLAICTVTFVSVAAPLRSQQPSVAATPQPLFTPDHANGIYASGERVGWTMTYPGAAPGAPLQYVYTVRQNGGDLLTRSTLDLTHGSARIETRLTEPGMVVVEVKPAVTDAKFGTRGTGGPGRVLLGAAIDPLRMHAAEPKPADFNEFWDAKLQALNAIAMSPVITPGESGKAGVEWSTIRLNNINGAHVYGQLAKPAREGKFPALLIYQWASPPYPLQKAWVTDRAAEGWIALNVEPHDVPPDMPQAFYDALPALIKNYHLIGQRSRDDSHFLQMYLGAYRAIEYMATRPDWDGRTIVVMGTSMGGQQSFAAAGLNPRVTALIVNVPAGADVTATLHGRGSSYPNWNVSRPDVRETARYFDTANFADRITARSLVAMGFIDDVATPAGIWSVFNSIKGVKEPVPMVDSPHNNSATPESERAYATRSTAWLDALVHGRDPVVLSPVPDR
jgi:cephalosporin-C deacetylase